MILTLHTETTIDSCHNLTGYDGKCSNMHGHTWLIELWFKGSSKNLDNVGILVDFGIVKKLKEELDHKYLNDVIHFNPTAEHLCEWIYEWLKNMIPIYVTTKVRLYETAVRKQTWCECGDINGN